MEMRRLLPIIRDFIISIVKCGLFVFPGIRSSRSQFWIRISSRISRNQHFQIASNCGGRSEITARVLYQLLYQLLIKKLEIKSETLFLSDFAMISSFSSEEIIYTSIIPFFIFLSFNYRQYERIFRSIWRFARYIDTFYLSFFLLAIEKGEKNVI